MNTIENEVKRVITPHKGGRTNRVDIRATPQTFEWLAHIKATRGLSASDLLELVVAVYMSLDIGDEKG